jgi:hypothetical protein
MGGFLTSTLVVGTTSDTVSRGSGLMSDDLTHEEMEAIATVVARLARGRGDWFDAEAAARRFASVARRNDGFMDQVKDAAVKVRAKASRNIEWDLRRLEQTVDELVPIKGRSRNRRR